MLKIDPVAVITVGIGAAIGLLALYSPIAFLIALGLFAFFMLSIEEL